MRRWIVLLLIAAACGGAGDVPGIGTVTSASGRGPAASIVVPGQLEELEIVTLDVGGRDLAVAVADTPSLRRTGLMFVTDLDDLDGMVFVYREDTTAAFHMENTLIPLDIAFFAADGSFVSKTTMEPCEVADCPTYIAEAGYRYAIEVPAGEFGWVGASISLDVRPLASER